MLNICYMIGIILSTLHVNLTILHKVDTVLIILIFLIYVKTQAQRDKVTCHRSHSQWVIEPGLELQKSDSRANPLNHNIIHPPYAMPKIATMLDKDEGNVLFSFKTCFFYVDMFFQSEFLLFLRIKFISISKINSNTKLCVCICACTHVCTLLFYFLFHLFL